MEFEVVLQDNEGINERETEAKQLMEAFNISETDLISGAYVDMMQKNTKVKHDTRQN